ncbi:CLEC4M [Branchiostoma lanceolatum]|uniref:CLEC4M protein n=1 Tax=Branchiostoma lanceolatum TaxID=7740 RepID=A0A8J9YTH8_BRALA|nr:CLEC4M [Branchiostoma lanceolatum]
MRAHCVIFAGCTLLLSVSSSAYSDAKPEDKAKNEDVSLLQLLADATTESKKTQQGASEEVVNILHDLRQKIEEGNGLVDEEPEPDDGIFKTEGCEDHQDGDEWGTSDHDNCYCQGQDRFCYHVDCLPGSEIVRKSDGLWDCPNGFTSGEEHTTDLGGPDDEAEVPPVAEEDRSLVRELADDGLAKTEGCQGHQVGDQWGTPEHDNCICTGSDRVCYRVNCLPGSEVVRDSSGPWNCDVGPSKRSITGNALMMQDNEKRVIVTATVLAAFGVFSGLVGITNFIWSRVGAAKTTRQLNEIQDQIRALDNKVDELTQSVSGLQLGQQYLQQVILYGRDELRLRNMLDTLAKMQVNNGQYTGIHDTEAWADSVLSHGSDGVQQVLYNLLDMVKPQSVLFGGKSLFEIYHEQLRGNIPEYREKMPRKVTQVYGLIGGGYAVWITALRIKGRTGEIPAKTQEAQQKLQSLEPNLEKYFKYGSCASGWQRRTSTCYKAFSLSKTWTEASAYCHTQGPGGMLAMSKDSGTNGFLISLKDAESSSWGFWFGLNDRAREGSYKWPDGTSLGSYKYWSPIEPNNGGKNWWGQYNNPEDCVEFFRTGWRNSNWNDAKCGNRRYFICERKPEGV